MITALLFKKKQSEHFLPSSVILRAQTQKLVEGKNTQDSTNVPGLVFKKEKILENTWSFLKGLCDKLPWELSSKIEVDVLKQMCQCSSKNLYKYSHLEG